MNAANEQLSTDQQRITERERAYVQEVLDTQFHTSAGSLMTTRLERKFAEVFHSNYAISFINGTATMHSALVAAGVGPGDEVIVPPDHGKHGMGRLTGTGNPGLCRY